MYNQICLVFNASLGTLLDNQSFRIIISLKLGRSHTHTPTHNLFCKKSVSRKSRHEMVNDLDVDNLWHPCKTHHYLIMMIFWSMKVSSVGIPKNLMSAKSIIRDVSITAITSSQLINNSMSAHILDQPTHDDHKTLTLVLTFQFYKLI